MSSSPSRPSAAATRCVSGSTSCSPFYLIFLVSMIIHYGLRAFRLMRGDSDGNARAGGKPMSAAFFWCLVALFGVAGMGAPVALSMIVSSIIYLVLKGQDLGLAAEQMIQGLFDSFLLLAIPLFITAANIMNAGTISGAAAEILPRARRALPRRTWPRQRGRQHDLRGHVRLRRRRRGRPRQDHHRDDAQG